VNLLADGFNWKAELLWFIRSVASSRCRLLVLRHGDFVKSGRKLAQCFWNAGACHGFTVAGRNDHRIEHCQTLHGHTGLLPILREVRRRAMQFRLLNQGRFKERFRLGGAESVASQQRAVFTLVPTFAQTGIECATPKIKMVADGQRLRSNT
jgi:hypothetical protein